jgi:hypothetical protein
MPFQKGNKFGNLNKGKISCNKGMPMSEEQKRKISDAHRGKKLSEETKKKISKTLIGRKNPEHSERMKGRVAWNKGIKNPSIAGDKNPSKQPGIGDKISKALMGANHPNWKGGVTRDRHSRDKKYKEWRTTVFKRDNYACWICEKGGKKLQAHHLYSWSRYKELRYIVNNGLTLCIFCHKTYTEYGFSAIRECKHIKFIKKKYKIND